MKKGIILLGAALLVSSARADVTVTAATGGTGVSADSATSGSWTSIGAITIDERVGSAKGDFTNGTRTIVFKAPSGFVFNTAVRPSISFTAAKDITSASISVTDSSTITATVVVGGVGSIDKLIIGSTTNIQVRATAGTPLASGDIYVTGTPGVAGITTATNTSGAGGTSFGDLIEVPGAGTSLTFAVQPAGATSGNLFTTQPVIKALDQFGNYTSNGLPANLNLVTTKVSGQGALHGTMTNNIGSSGGKGTVSHTDLYVDSMTGNNVQLQASASGLGSVLSSIFKVEKSSQTITFPALTNKVYGDAPFVVTATASSGLTVTFQVVSGPATIAGNVVTLTGTGLVTIRASQSGGSDFISATPVDQSFTVTKGTPVITWNNPADIVYSAALDGAQLNATASVGGSMTYTPAAGTVLNAGSNQVLSVLFVATDTNYDNATATVLINVLKTNQTITFNPITDKTYGDADFAVNATASSSLPVSLSVISGPATISSNTISITGSGTVTVRASQSGDNNFGAATDVDQTFEVKKVIATVTWSAPADIIYGAALTTNELSATVSVAGTFSYTPALGTVLDAGTNQQLTVLFTPDNTNYTTAAATNSINVQLAPLSVVANNVSRGVGETNPVFGGTLSGVVNGDDITATYFSAADLLSVVGTYDIVPTLVDPNNRLSNYSVTITNGTLTVADLRPPLPATPARLSAQRLGNGHFMLQLQGAATNHVYSIEATDSLAGVWQKIGEAANVSGAVSYEDANVSASSTRFYRAVAQ